jgi:mRNA-degrading endonuclease RelE of RelBE toxin-antitoxin system
MRYSIKIKRTAQKSLAKMSQSLQDRIVEVIKELENEPRPPGCKNYLGEMLGELGLEIIESFMRFKMLN